jgi:integral membrane protein
VRRFFTPGWLGLHALAGALFSAFLWFGWWQFHRAVEGNGRSWGYTFEWPIFAVFVVVMWIKMMYDELHPEKKETAEKAKKADEAGIVTAAQVIMKYTPIDSPTMAGIVAPIHGALYMVYLVMAFDLWRRTGWPVGRMVGMVLAGIVPFMTFVIERKVVRDARVLVEA